MKNAKLPAQLAQTNHAVCMPTIRNTARGCERKDGQLC